MSSDANPSQTSRQSARFAAAHAHRAGRRKYLWATLLLLLSLGAGMAIGVGGTVMYFNSKKFKRPPRPEEVGDAITKSIIEFLELNEKEAADLKKVVAVRMQAVREIREDSWDAIRDEFDVLSQETKAIVGSERYKKWEVERDRRLGERKHLNEKRTNGERERRPRRERSRRGASPPPAPSEQR